MEIIKCITSTIISIVLFTIFVILNTDNATDSEAFLCGAAFGFAICFGWLAIAKANSIFKQLLLKNCDD